MEPKRKAAGWSLNGRILVRHASVRSDTNIKYSPHFCLFWRRSPAKLSKKERAKQLKLEAKKLKTQKKMQVRACGNCIVTLALLDWESQDVMLTLFDSGVARDESKEAVGSH